jgi:hypothetical protein
VVHRGFEAKLLLADIQLIILLRVDQRSLPKAMLASRLSGSGRQSIEDFARPWSPGIALDRELFIISQSVCSSKHYSLTSPQIYRVALE